MTDIRVFRSTFYLLLTSIFLENVWILSRPMDWKPKFIWLAKIIYFFIPFSPLQTYFLFLLTLTVLCLCVLKDHMILRILASFLLIFFFSIKYSFGTISHNYRIWIFASIFFIFLDSANGLKTTRNILVLRLIQSSQLLSYFCSGIWKTINLTEDFSLKLFMETPLEHIAYAVAEKGKPLSPLISLLVYQYPWFLGLGFFLVLVFQFSSIVPIVTGRYYFLFGLFAMVFHITTGFAMNIWFLPMIVSALYFFIYTEAVLLNPKTQSST